MKRSQKYLSSEAHGYLREAKACSLVLKDLERISAKLQRQIDKEAAARQADFEEMCIRDSMKGCGYGIREIASREKLPIKRIKELLEEVRAVFLELCYE